MERTAAAANGLRTNAACSVPVRSRSPVNLPRPSSIRRSWVRGTGAPTQVTGAPGRRSVPVASVRVASVRGVSRRFGRFGRARATIVVASFLR